LFSVKTVKDHSAKNEVKTAVRKLAGPAVAGGFFSFFITLAMLAVPVYMLSIYDKVLTSRSEDTLFAITIVVLGVLMVLAVLEGIRSRVLLGMGMKMDRLLSDRVFEAIFDCQRKRPGSNPTMALSDLSTVRQFVSSKSVVAYFDAPWAPLFLILLFAVHFVIGVVVCVGLAIIVMLAFCNDFLSRKATLDGHFKQQEANRIVEKSIGNLDVLTSLGMIGRLRERWRSVAGEAADLHGKATARSETIDAILNAMRFIVQVSVLGTAAYLAIQDQVSPGMIIASNLLAMRTVAPFEQVVTSWGGLVRAISSLRRIDDLLQKFPQEIHSVSIAPTSGKVEALKLAYIPPGSQSHVVKGVTFDVASGASLGVIGPSGAGKSSLGRMLVGAVKPAAGIVRLDGYDITQWSPDVLGPYLGYLPQDVELFGGTIAENICRFSGASAEEIVRAAQLANAHELIQRLPEGYETFIGEGGVRLSGGQQQRIGLARALFGRPKLIVLDEPNANLDIDGMNALTAALANLKEQGATVILITHSPQLLRNMDLTLMLRDGIVERFGPSIDILPEIIPGLRKVPVKKPQASLEGQAPTDPSKPATG